MSAFEVSTARERAFNLSEGGQTEVVRVTWRPKGQRRWSSFLMVPDDDQTLDELEEFAEDAVAKVAGAGLVLPSGASLRRTRRQAT